MQQLLKRKKYLNHIKNEESHESGHYIKFVRLLPSVVQIQNETDNLNWENTIYLSIINYCLTILILFFIRLSIL